MFSTCFEVIFRQKFLPSAPWVVEKSPRTFPKTLFKHVLLDFFDVKTLCPVHPGDSKKFHRNGKEFKFSKISKNVSKIVQTCFGVIFSKFFGQCTLEGREVEKFQRNAKTSQNSRYPNTFPKVSKQVLNLFWGFSRKKVPSAPWRVETRKKYKKVEKLRNFQNSPRTFPKTLFDHVLHDYFDGKKLCPVHPGDSKKFHRNGKEFKFSKISKNVSKIVQTCFDVNFSKLFGQCTLEGREVEKFQRNAKTSQNSRYPNTFPKVSKQVLNLFWGFSRKKSAQCTLEGRNLEKFEKKSKTIWNFKSVQKCSWKCPNKFWNCFEVILSEKNAQCNLVSRNLEKLQKTKNFQFFKMPKKRSQKQSNMFWTCFEVFFLEKNFCPVHPGWSKISKNTKKWKNCETLKFLQKRSQKHCLSMFCLIISTEKSSAQWTLETQKNPQESKRLKKFKIPKNVIKIVQTCLR